MAPSKFTRDLIDALQDKSIIAAFGTIFDAKLKVLTDSWKRSGSVSAQSAAYSALSVLLFSSTMYLSYRDKFLYTVLLVVLLF